jgi:DHA2 family multidrug resistance protein
MRYRSVAVGSLIAFVFGMLIFAPAILTPLYSSLILGYTALGGGLLLALRALPVVFLTPIFATLSERGVDVRYFLGSGFLLSAVSLIWMALNITSQTPFAPLATALFFSGIGQSMLLVPLIVGVLSTTPASLNGKITPIITLCVQLGGSIASATSIAFFDRRTSFHATALSSSVTLHNLSVLSLSRTGNSLQQLAGLVFQQASTMAFADAIFAVGILAALVAPLVLAFPRSKGNADEPGSSFAH